MGIIIIICVIRTYPCFWTVLKRVHKFLRNYGLGCHILHTLTNSSNFSESVLAVTLVRSMNVPAMTRAGITGILRLLAFVHVNASSFRKVQNEAHGTFAIKTSHRVYADLRKMTVVLLQHALVTIYKMYKMKKYKMYKMYMNILRNHVSNLFTYNVISSSVTSNPTWIHVTPTIENFFNLNYGSNDRNSL